MAHTSSPDPYSLLVCPGCAAPLALSCFESEESGRCRSGLLRCPQCRGWYAVVGGIPRLLLPGPLRSGDDEFLERWRGQLPADLALPASTAIETDRSQVQVQSAFAHKWTRQAWWGMEGESARVIEEWLLPRYGWESPESYRSFMGTRERMLDAGAGLGRETLRMATANPAALVFGLELSACVDEAAAHAREAGVPNAFFVQADLMGPPFAAGTFDFVFSEGVLHHTADTRRALESVARLVKPGGEIGFYVYRRKAPLREYADDFVRAQIQGLVPEEAWRLLEPLTRFGKALSDLKAEVEVPEDVPLLGIPAGRVDVQRLVYYTMFKCYWNDRLTFDENVHVNFDWYYPRYAWRQTEEELREWLDVAGFAIVHERVEESGITVRAARSR